MKKIACACILTLIGTATLTGCTTTPNIQQELTPYLNQFLGKTVTDVKSTINFSQFNVKTTEKPILSNQSLTYRIVRSVKIPIPSYVPMSTGGTQSTTIQAGSLAESYDVNFYCDVKFNLSKDIVTNWSYSGKAC